jgi:hypothetical protein
MIEVRYYNSDTEDYEVFEVRNISQLIEHLDEAHIMMWIEGIGDLMSARDVALMRDLSRVLYELNLGD